MRRIVHLFCLLCTVAACGPRDGEYTFHLLTTNDVHGRYFDSLYVDGGTRESLLAVSSHVDSVRAAVGKENVILVDAGDCMQGDNAAYYFNYVDTLAPHLYARMAEYMGYDAVAVGNHDIETGHQVYDRVRKRMKIPFLAANAVRTTDGMPYFQDYTVFKRHGIRIAVMGFTNPAIRNWLSGELWEGMEFESLVPYVQESVDRMVAKEHPDAVIVAVHSGTGDGDGSSLENQGLELFNTLEGVDFVVCAHDHRPAVYEGGDICLINSGSHCRNIGHGVLRLTVKDGKCVSKSLSAGLVPVDKSNVDMKMRDMFRADYEAVKDFTLRPVGELKADLVTKESYKGVCDYMNLLHTLSLSASPAQISFAAPLTPDGCIKAGTLLFNDLFTIYPFENQLFVVKMTGSEIKDYLEYSYDTWINTWSGPDGHLLRIRREPDQRTGNDRWSFENMTYNFDSAGGLHYTVDVTKPAGKRVRISSLADGTPFNPDAGYNVAMTSYRANGGGSIMRSGAGIDTDRIDDRIVARYPEIRNILHDYLISVGTIDPAVTGDASVIGHWEFIPSRIAAPALERDMELLSRMD